MKEGQGKTVAIILVCLALGSISYGQIRQYEETTGSQVKKNLSLYVENSEFDFGQVTQGKKVSGITVIRNISEEILKIERIDSDIPGIYAEISDLSLAPDEEGTISVTLDSTMLSGQIIGRIAIKTDREENPEVILTVRANVETTLAFQPQTIFAGQIAKDASFSGRAMLGGRLIKEGKLQDFEIQTSSSAIEVKIQDPTAGLDGVLVEFVLKPDLKAGTFQEFITVISDDPPVEAQLKLLGQKLGIIRVTPDRFEFFPRNGKMPKKLEIIFECEKIFKITKVEDLTQSLNLSVKTIKKGKKYRLTAKQKKSAKIGILGVVKVHTDLEEHPLIHIPVIGGRSR
jgi:hypothetical protein